MIAILAPAPTSLQNDGYMQRVREIDSILKNVARVYIEKTKKWESVGVSKISDLTYKIIIPDGSDEATLAKLLAPAIKNIYIHSIYQYNIFSSLVENLKAAHNSRVLLDAHGVVPEEVLLSTSEPTLESKWQLIEKNAFKATDLFIFVTSKMKQHFVKKYQLNEMQTAVLPISRDHDKKNNTSNFKSKFKTYKTSPLFIYAGGAQAWQRTDRMATAINNTKMDGFILSHDERAFKKIITRAIAIDKTDPKGVIEKLKNVHFSFVLREANLINNVACPTKLIEAMTYGCLPIIESPELGDFNDLGFSYLSLADFERNKLPSLIEFENAILNNRKIVESLFNNYASNAEVILSKLELDQLQAPLNLDLINGFIIKERNRILRNLVFSKNIFVPREAFRLLRYMVMRNEN